eukprot:CAMPEP_0203936564 /NCGR_PEP_ID=MMETSP0359-20131031/74061_1 /ASSEMBLY_ACC=CAM_ASM_000338 /TAXON_ID=268821 /ORGANISM="Scrippsiella Hangoei, Strain SHTV-5" /LENGTH=42 /DNA_ID= /DNA_START= /DNA_END= /DNA_ORIENTATION=
MLDLMGRKTGCLDSCSSPLHPVAHLLLVGSKEDRIVDIDGEG